jgi:predicted transcriptional regulator
MGKQEDIIAGSITATLDAETLAMVDRVSQVRGLSAADFAAEAIRRVAESETDFQAFVQVGVDAADRGDLIPHEQVMAELEAMIRKHQDRCQA